MLDHPCPQDALMSSDPQYMKDLPQKPQASLYLTITAWIFMTEGLLWQDHGPLSSQT